MLTVACFFWLDPARKRSYQISPNDVLVWDRMIKRNLTIPHRRVCITHRPDLIDFMDTLAIDPTKHVPGSCLVKLMVHRPGIEEVLGPRICTMDVDCVVTGNLDSVLDRKEKVVLWKNPNYEQGGKRGFYQGSMQLFDAGAMPELWQDLNNQTLGLINRRFGGAEQAWISERLNATWPSEGWEWDKPHWTESDGVYGAGRLFNGKMGEGVQSELPANAKIVFTPGDRAPSQPEVQAAHPWIKEYWH
jgi:hypothetical protein